ncbi:LON peptidase substrate-binding domain-containing protein [Deinococcus sp. VB343]|uniref:LON peptidase substrate-binding domain-containing protein n=1 Tax=Deinococcus sp. VB343 TaxID=3385567 RepID=UPI0039C96BD6
MPNSADPCPLFPLPTVLFPGQVLPIYVFEERYRALLRRVQETGQPFGILCIERSSRESALPLHERVSRVGSFAHLLQAETHEDGTSSVVVAGGERFRVQEFDLSQPYLSGILETWPLAQPEKDLDLTELRARQLLAGLQRTWPARAAFLEQDAPQEPLLLASYAAGLLLAQGCEANRADCNDALGEPTLARRLERLLGALPCGSTHLLN